MVLLEVITNIVWKLNNKFTLHFIATENQLKDPILKNAFIELAAALNVPRILDMRYYHNHYIQYYPIFIRNEENGLLLFFPYQTYGKMFYSPVVDINNFYRYKGIMDFLYENGIIIDQNALMDLVYENVIQSQKLLTN